MGSETLAGALVEVWRQALAEGAAHVELADRRYRVARSRSKGLRVVAFTFGDHQVDGIEQNPETKSRWAQLAREGKRVMQFTARGRYFANVCEGTVTRYPAWRALGLPE